MQYDNRKYFGNIYRLIGKLEDAIYELPIEDFQELVGEAIFRDLDSIKDNIKDLEISLERGSGDFN